MVGEDLDLSADGAPGIADEGEDRCAQAAV